MACEMHGCCFLANPVVANETTGAGLYTKEKECYQQPLTDYPEWFSLPFGTCSRDCHDANANFDKDDADAEVYPTRYRENVCMFTNGSVASDILCGEPPLQIPQHAICTSIAQKQDAERVAAERMVVASAYIIHKLIRGSLTRSVFAILDGRALIAM